MTETFRGCFLAFKFFTGGLDLAESDETVGDLLPDLTTGVGFDLSVAFMSSFLDLSAVPFDLISSFFFTIGFFVLSFFALFRDCGGAGLL